MQRRFFLAGGLSYAMPLGAAGHTIESYELFHVRVNHRGNWLLLRVKSNKGLTGIADASHGGSDERTMVLLKKYFEWCKGRSPFDVEAYRTALMNTAEKDGRSGAVAFSAFEQAMHDLQGKILDLPCWELFGGKLRDRIRHYANINRATVDRSPAGFAALAEPAVKAGFDAIKMASFDGLPKEPGTKRQEAISLGIACAEAVRKVIGPERALLVDGHSNFSLEEGLEVTRRLEPLKLFWWEEVVPGIGNLAEINRQTNMPTAGGESIFGVKNFYPYVAGGAVDIVMPDVKYCGGMLELKKISAMAEGAGLLSAPHGPASPVGNRAAAQVCLTLPNFHILELGFGEVPWRGELIEPPEVFENGYLSLTNSSTSTGKPGLGIEINERLARAHPV